MAEAKLEIETELDKVIKELQKIRDIQKNQPIERRRRNQVEQRGRIIAV